MKWSARAVGFRVLHRLFPFHSTHSASLLRLPSRVFFRRGKLISDRNGSHGHRRRDGPPRAVLPSSALDLPPGIPSLVLFLAPPAPIVTPASSQFGLSAPRLRPEERAGRAQERRGDARGARDVARAAQGLRGGLRQVGGHHHRLLGGRVVELARVHCPVHVGVRRRCLDNSVSHGSANIQSGGHGFQEHRSIQRGD